MGLGARTCTPQRLRFVFATTLAVPLASWGCRGVGGGSDLQETTPSPQASAEPAPLAAGPAGAGPGLQAMRGDQSLPPDVVPRDVVPPGVRDVPSTLTGYTLTASLHVGDVPPPPAKAQEMNGVAVEAARRRSELRWTADFVPARLRVALAGAFLLPEGTELRARADRYGHVVVWPDGRSYRPMPPGSLRALLGERRFDVAPLSRADLSVPLPLGDGAKRFGLRVRRVDVVTRAARGTFDIAHAPEAGEGGALLCRLLLDLVNGPPSVPLCGDGDVPVHVELRWASRGSLTFDAQSLTRRTDLPPTILATPPATAAFVDGPWPPPLPEVMLPPGELASFRASPVDVPPPPPSLAGEAGAGMLLINTTDLLRTVWVDGVPVAWVGPGGRLRVPGLVRGRYALQWRTFLGDAVEPVTTVTVPGVSTYGVTDAGAPP